jgi:AcrR family transcriptional regulator
MTKQEHILEAAEELFAEHGFDGTSVRALAAKAGVNVAMISYYFGSKEKLFEALVEYRASYLREKLQTMNKEIQDPVTRIDLLIEYYVDRIFDQHRFHRILFRQISLQQRSELNKSIAVILKKNSEEIRKILLDGQEKKVFRDVDIDLTIATLVGTISQATLSLLLHCRIDGTETIQQIFYSQKNRERLKVFLKELLHAFLISKDHSMLNPPVKP